MTVILSEGSRFGILRLILAFARKHQAKNLKAEILRPLQGSG